MVSSNNAINNTVGASISGVTNTFSVINPSDTASSAARETITVGGASAGDPSINFNVNSLADWEMGIDNNEDDTLKISQGTSLGTNDTWIMTSDGERTMPLQPAFYGALSIDVNNVTGNGTLYLVIWDTERFDQGGDYDTTTGLFTCPVDGNYQFNACVPMGGIVASNEGRISFRLNGAEIGCSTRCQLSQIRDAGGNLAQNISMFIDLDAGDTVGVNYFVNGGAQVAGIRATSNNTFNGFLSC